MSGRARTPGGGIDFSRLYAELAVDPAHGIDAFKQAYRRRVAELHPDRPGPPPRDADRLVALRHGYAAVLDFHRAHGRLPGAAPDAGRRAARAGATGGAAPQDPPSAPTPAGDAPPPSRIGRMHALMLPALVVASLWYWLADRRQVAPPPAAAMTAAPLVARSRPLAQLGMDRGTVAGILGQPLVRDDADAHWIYGASWVHFDCDQLSDWYSSPLQPLSVASATPPPAEGGRGKACPELPRTAHEHPAARGGGG